MIKYILIIISINFFFGCNKKGVNDSLKDKPTNGQDQGHAKLDAWKVNSLGQEGHGGDAVVCFSIPIEQALYRVTPKKNSSCLRNLPCENKSETASDQEQNGPAKVMWRMTDVGRKSIRSAKPLEQFLAERITGLNPVIAQLNQGTLTTGYNLLRSKLAHLPAAYEKNEEIHQALGWLEEDGIATEYGLADINDSGFATGINQKSCKELQAVVRKDNQLWYDPDIIGHFDTAGKILIQLHEEIYRWGKLQDQSNSQYGDWAHGTSINTRHLILKILKPNISTKLLNTNLKVLGFSSLFWQNRFAVPTPVGQFMTSDVCLGESMIIKNYLDKNRNINSVDMRDYLVSRYLLDELKSVQPILLSNYPRTLSELVSYTLNFTSGDESSFWQVFRGLWSDLNSESACLPIN
ncbi:MAG: hypothetical protein HOO06_15170 [Bdellovibrionaceae bacterium]|jgi:hypothetical protein|nr:hypothetical protein [Pseudobdellovibrionaceae bacterium]